MSAMRQSVRFAAAAVVLVAATYIYFLLFAQFGFLQGIRATGLGADAIKTVLAAMAIAGVAASLVAPRAVDVFGRGGTMGLGLVVCAGAAGSAGFAFAGGIKTIGHLLIAAIGTGAGLGLLAVGVAADLRRLTRARNVGLYAGCGTGIAYFVCNIPSVYGAPPQLKAWGVAILAATVMVVVGCSRGLVGPEETPARALVPTGWTSGRGLPWAVAGFFALVWFDSAAFAALQLAPEIHNRQWGVDASRWINGSTHAIAAVAGGILLDRGLLRSVLAAAMLALMGGAMMFAITGRSGAFAAPLYVTAVSLYSTALVAFAPLSPVEQGRDTAAWRATWIYAFAGWIGSAAGVGLAEHVGRLPVWAAPVAAAMLALALWQSRVRRVHA
jgi:cytochrome c oxidase cbb3-type subunit 2